MNKYDNLDPSERTTEKYIKSYTYEQYDVGRIMLYIIPPPYRDQNIVIVYDRQTWTNLGFNCCSLVSRSGDCFYLNTTKMYQNDNALRLKHEFNKLIYNTK